jgi:ABC-2 type transport system ATP-binding protein
MQAIDIKNLRKTYLPKKQFGKKMADTKEALKGVDIQIPQGSFYGLLGPNGAGKSTIINIIAGLVNKTSGNVIVNGFDLDVNPREVRRSIGIVPQEVVIDPFFNVYDTLEFYAGYYGVPKKQRRTDEILEALNLTDKAKASPRRLSGGMKRRLLIAKALVHNPPILILDEPTAGVDVELRSQLWDYVRKLNKQGTTIVLTTHYLEEAEELCDRISIINNGEVIADDSTSKLLSSIDQKILVITTKEKLNNIPFELSGFQTKVNDVKGAGTEIEITFSKSEISAAEIIVLLQAANIQIKDISTKEPNLEDVFRKLVKM